MGAPTSDTEELDFGWKNGKKFRHIEFLEQDIMNHRIIISLLSVSAFATMGFAQDSENSLTTQKDQVSYAIGYNLGTALKRQSFDVDPAIIARAIGDILNGNEPAMSQTDARQALQDYQQQMQQKQEQERLKVAAKNKEAAAAWLAENAQKDGVITLASGLQYKVLEQGDGESPTKNDRVKVHYRGTLLDGTEFDSSYSRGQPAEFRVTGVIPGWTEAIQLMKAGDKWELFIPSDLAYGDRGQGDNIKPGSTLRFEVELLEVIKPEPITSDIIKVPSAEEMARGAKIETIKADDLKRIEAEAKEAQQSE